MNGVAGTSSIELAVCVGRVRLQHGFLGVSVSSFVDVWTLTISKLRVLGYWIQVPGLGAGVHVRTCDLKAVLHQVLFDSELVGLHWAGA